MIAASELRIGSLIYLELEGNREVHKVIGKFISDIENGIRPYGCDIHPIPLTPEILVKAGFEFRWGTYDRYSEVMLIMLEYVGSHCQLKVSGRCASIPFQYLHQLQNLYFALTGTELEVNLK